MPTGPSDGDKARNGPLGPVQRQAKEEDEGWRTVPGKPWLQVNVLTGKYRTNGYKPEGA